MCGRYTLRSSPELLQRHYEIVEKPAFTPLKLRFNIAPIRGFTVAMPGANFLRRARFVR